MNQPTDLLLQTPNPPPVVKHSGLGIASFIISLLVGGGMFLVIVVAGFMQVQSPGGLDEKSPAAFIVGFLVIGGLLLDLGAIGLGIAGLFQKERKKIFPILGLVISGVVLIGTLGLMILGLMTK